MRRKKIHMGGADGEWFCPKCKRDGGLLRWETERGVFVCISCVPDEVLEASNYGRWRARHEALRDLQIDIQDALPSDTVLELMKLAERALKLHAPFSTVLGIAAVQAEQVLNLVTLVCNETLPDAVELAIDTDAVYATEKADPDECALCGHSRYAHEDSYSCAPGECSAEGDQLVDGVQVEGQPCECRGWEAAGSPKALKLARNKHHDQSRDHGHK